METEPAPKDSHRLAVFCLVLALGALLDLDKPTLSADASQYYQLGRAVLSLDSILESQSIPAIQALVRVYVFTTLNSQQSLSTFIRVYGCLAHLT